MSQYVFRRLLLLILCSVNFTAFAASPGPWEKSPVGSCFAKIDDYLSWQYGASYDVNEHIGTSALPNVGKQRSGVNYVWASDNSSENPSTVLFRIGTKGRACAVLESLAGMSVLLEYSINGLLPRKVFAEETEPHQTAVSVSYEYNGRTRTYLPQKCYRTVKATMKVVHVDCNNELDLR